MKLRKCYAKYQPVKPHWFLTAAQGFFSIYPLGEWNIDVFKEIKPTAPFTAYIIYKPAANFNHSFITVFCLLFFILIYHLKHFRKLCVCGRMNSDTHMRTYECHCLLRISVLCCNLVVGVLLMVLSRLLFAAPCLPARLCRCSLLKVDFDVTEIWCVAFSASIALLRVRAKHLPFDLDCPKRTAPEVLWFLHMKFFKPKPCSFQSKGQAF